MKIIDLQRSLRQRISAFRRIIAAAMILALLPVWFRADAEDKAQTDVTPQMFGAAADGVTDDAKAILDAICYAKEKGLRVFFPKGIYAVSSQVISVKQMPGEDVYLYGEGRESLIKRMDESLPPYKGKTIWAWLFYFTTDKKAEGTESCSITIRDLAVDSNRRNQSAATDRYTHEASADMMFRATSAAGYWVRSVDIENMYFTDGVADHIDFSSSGLVKIHNVTLKNIVCEGRMGTRNCIDFPGYIDGTVYAEDIICDRFHTEYNSAPLNEMKIRIKNMLCKDCTLVGGNRNVEITLENVEASRRFCIAGCKTATVRNCTVHLTGEQSNHYLMDIRTKDGEEDHSEKQEITFDRCTFISEGTAPYKGETVAPALYIRRNSSVLFSNCVFDAAEDYDSMGIKSYPVYTDGVTDPDHLTVVFDNCNISGRFTYGVMAYSANVIMKNMTFVNRYPAFFRCVNDYRCAYLTFENCVNTAESGGGLYWEVKRHNTEDTRKTACISGEMICTEQNFAVRDSVEGTLEFNTNHHFDMHRTIYLSQPLDYKTLKKLYSARDNENIILIAGDEFIYTGDEKERYPEKWIVTKTVKGRLNYLFPDQWGISKYIETEGSGSGTSGERPKCYLSKGFRYFDTEKKITYEYTGNGWKKAE